MIFLKKFWHWILTAVFGLTAVYASTLIPTDTEKIQAFQADYFSKYGQYAQILPNQEFPDDMPLTQKNYAQTKLNFTTDKPFAVDVWGAPDGTQGNKIRWIEPVIHDSDTASTTSL